MSNKYNLNKFMNVIELNKKINRDEQDEQKVEKKEIMISNTQEVDLSRFNFWQINWDIKNQKSLALNESDQIRLEKLCKILNIYVFKKANRAISEVIEMDI